MGGETIPAVLGNGMIDGMLKWAGIIGVLALIVGILILGGIIELAAGMMKLAFFIALALVAALVLGGWVLKRKVTGRR